MKSDKGAATGSFFLFKIILKRTVLSVKTLTRIVDVFVDLWFPPIKNRYRQTLGIAVPFTSLSKRSTEIDIVHLIITYHAN